VWVIAVGALLGGLAQARVPITALGIVLAAAALAPAVGVLTSGVHAATYRAIEADEPGLAAMFRQPRALVAQAAALGAIQAAGFAGLALNVGFYLSLRSPIGLALAILFGYGLLTWLAMCHYQWPLLTAGGMGRIAREGGGPPRLRSVFRNSLVLVAAAPLYSLGLALTIIVLATPLVISGVGLMLVAPALTAFLATQAVRDHMVSLGMVAPQDEGPAPADTWSVPR
jgi:hypothetical protein